MTYRTASRQGKELKLKNIAGLRSETARRLDFKENAERKAVLALCQAVKKKGQFSFCFVVFKRIIGSHERAVTQCGSQSPLG